MGGIVSHVRRSRRDRATVDKSRRDLYPGHGVTGISPGVYSAGPALPSSEPRHVACLPVDRSHDNGSRRLSRLNDGRTAQSVVVVAPHDPLRTAVT